jgi:hypothetical protein
MNAERNLMPNFETFEKRRTPPASEPLVTLLRTGVISMNVVSYELLGRPEHLEFAYARSEEIIALRPVKERTQFSYPIRELKSGAGGTFSVSAKAFLQFYGIPIGASVRRVAFLDDELLCVDLRNPGVDVTTGRTAEEGI